MEKNRSLKRWILAFNLLVAGFFLVKIIVLGGLARTSLSTDVALLDSNPAMAQSPAKTPKTPPARSGGEDSLARERKLMASLLEKEEQVESRENALKAEEKKLAALKGEIVTKIDALKSLEEKLGVMLDQTRAVEDKRYKDLANVFEATPPAQAGSMLERLDKKTAAGILMNMKSKKAGAVWGHINPQKAAEITKEITQTARAKSE